MEIAPQRLHLNGAVGILYIDACSYRGEIFSIRLYFVASSYKGKHAD